MRFLECQISKRRIIMGYNIMDLISKGRDIAVRRKFIFENIGKENLDNSSVKIISRVLIKEVENTIQYYERLEREASNEDFEEIDLVTYNKISFLINEFNKKVCAPKISNVSEYLKFSLDLERDTYALLIDVRGRLIRNASDAHTMTYYILSDIINNIAIHIATLEKTIK
jgi:hypothetical protein